MRIAVVSDVHGSLTPLEAVIADIEGAAPDAVVHGGDLALMGPLPAEVVDRIRELGWPGVVGNTDEVLWRPEERERQLERAPKIAPVIQVLFDEYAPVTLELLGDERVDWLHSLPAEHRVEELVVTHAAPGDLWRAPVPEAEDQELEETYAGLGPGAVAYGHVHRPYSRRVSGELVVANAGSVAMPWDGDPRASYLLVEDGEPRVVRVEYDVEREAALIEGSAHPDTARLAEMRRRGRFLPPGWRG